MSLSAAVIDALVAAGATVEQLAAAMKADLAETESRARIKRDKDAARQRKSRLSRNVTVTPRDTADAPPPNDNISNPPGITPASNEAVSLFPEIVVSTWNEMAAANDLAPARKLSPSRLKHLKARIREHSEEAVLEAIRKLGGSDWHCGRSASGWCADLGWLLKSPENFQKILERSSVNGRHPLSPEPGVNARAAHGFVFGP